MKSGWHKWAAEKNSPDEDCWIRLQTRICICHGDKHCPPNRYRRGVSSAVCSQLWGSSSSLYHELACCGVWQHILWHTVIGTGKVREYVGHLYLTPPCCTPSPGRAFWIYCLWGEGSGVKTKCIKGSPGQSRDGVKRWQMGKVKQGTSAQYCLVLNLAP